MDEQMDEDEQDEQDVSLDCEPIVRSEIESTYHFPRTDQCVPTP